MSVSSYPWLALIAGLAAFAAAGSALLVRSQITEPPQDDSQSNGAVTHALARKLSLYLFGMAALMAALALILEMGSTISGLVGFSSAYICEAVLALNIGLISVTMRHSYRNLRRDDGLG